MIKNKVPGHAKRISPVEKKFRDSLPAAIRERKIFFTPGGRRRRDRELSTTGPNGSVDRICGIYDEVIRGLRTICGEKWQPTSTRSIFFQNKKTCFQRKIFQPVRV